MGFVVAGDYQQAAGVLVQTVDDPGALGIGAAAEYLRQLRDQGRPAVRGRRVNHHPGRLVDHGEVVVEVDDAQLRAPPGCGATPASASRT